MAGLVVCVAMVSIMNPPARWPSGGPTRAAGHDHWPSQQLDRVGHEAERTDEDYKADEDNDEISTHAASLRVSCAESSEPASLHNHGAGAGSGSRDVSDEC